MCNDPRELERPVEWLLWLRASRYVKERGVWGADAQSIFREENPGKYSYLFISTIYNIYIYIGDTNT